ncbi:hypothetical protein Gekk315_00023 [Aeromonas phage Gekk3-15]
MLIDKFVMQWTADTQSATMAIDTLESKARNVAKNAGSELEKGFKQIGDSANKAVNEIKDAELKSVGKNNAADRQSKQNIKDTANAHAEGSKSASKWSDVIQKMRTMFSSGGGDGGGIAGGAGALMGKMGAGKFGTGVASMLPGMSGLMAIGGAATIGAAALMVFSTSVNAANDQAEKAMHVRKEAWETGRNQTGYNQQVLAGKRMGLTEGETKAGLTGLADRLRDAVTDPYGEAALRFRQAGIKTGTAQNPRDIESTTRAVENYMRALSKNKGEAEGIAWATQRMGMTFEMAQAIVGQTDEEFQKRNEGLRGEAMLMTASQQEAKKYAMAKREVDFAMERSSIKLSREVTPSLTKFSEAMSESANKTNGVISIMGKFTAGIIDMGTKMLSFLDEKTSQMSDAYDEQEERKGLYEFGKANGVAFDNAVTEQYTDATYAKLKEMMQAQAAERGRLEGSGAPVAPDDNETSAAKRIREVSAAMAKFQQTLRNRSDLDDSEKQQMAMDAERAKDAVEKDGADVGTLSDILTQILGENKKHTKELAAQTKHGTPPIPVTPVTIGLEQALSLWASGLGKAAQLRGPEGAADAGTRGEYEKAARAQIEMQRNISYNANALVSEQTAQQALIGAKGAASSAANSAPVNITQENNFSITTSKDGQSGAMDIARQVNKVVGRNNADLANSSATTWRS